MWAQKLLRSIVIFLAGVIVGMALFRWMLLRRLPSMNMMAPAAQLSSAPAHVLSDFTFTDRSGKKIGLADLKGHYWLADFFFTRCQGPCPLLTSTMARFQKEFENKKDLRFVSFTVDPEFDTPEVLSKYAEMFGADKKRWYFLSGPKEKVYQLIQEGFQLAVGPDEKDPIQVVHSLSFVLIGKEGEVLGHFNTNEPEMLTNLREQLKELP